LLFPLATPTPTFFLDARWGSPRPTAHPPLSRLPEDI
jgi:hypothetical protein